MIKGIKGGVSIMTLLGPPLAFGALTSAVIGGLGVGAVVIAAVAVPTAGKLVRSFKSLPDKSMVPEKDGAKP